MSDRIFNFAAGPCTLPLPALERAQNEFTNYDSTGMSIIEHSHRGKAYDTVHNDAISNLKELLSVPDDFEILLLHGGATMQFVSIPMNLAKAGHPIDYVITGAWAKKAAAEGKRYDGYKAIWTGEDDKFMRMPAASEIKASADSSYVHICSNETIGGIEMKEYPDTGDVPLIADVSSHIMSNALPFDRLSMIYAGAQKNLGPAGVGVVIMKKSLIEGAKADLPAFLSYKTHADKGSMYNTPPVFAIYMMKLTLDWVKENGGVAGMSGLADKRSQLLYSAIDDSDNWFNCPVDKNSRSRMNIVWRLPSEELEKKFVAEATAAGMAGLKGHRSVGGCRASMYNAMPVEGAAKLAQFMSDFKKANS
jgi:phosphoserine aminotransferase